MARASPGISGRVASRIGVHIAAIAGSSMKLYHFTSPYHLSSIQQAGKLMLTESNLSENVEHFGPDVVWLTDNPDPRANSWDRGSAVDKLAVRITVEVPDDEVHRWIQWSGDRDIAQEWANTLEAGDSPASWYVVEREIPKTEWLAIDILALGSTPIVS